MYCIIGENVGVDKSAGTNDYSATPRPTTSSVCKNKKDGERCIVGGCDVNNFRPIFLGGMCWDGTCKREVCGDLDWIENKRVNQS